MIKSIADISLRLADLLEAEGRVARMHAVHFLIAGLIFGMAALLCGGGLLFLAAAALLGFVSAGLSWPVALTLVGFGILAVAIGLGVAGRVVLERRPAFSSGPRPAARPASAASPENHYPAGGQAA